ncbi:MAG TPA: AAA family ATPase [Rhodocyclaceae bacterium]|nr:AAA family ATPase [Rhodocyclaceae bacterium]
MDLEITDALAGKLLGKIEENCALAKQLAEHRNRRGRIVVSSKLFNGDALNTLYDLCKAADERALMFQLLALDNIHGSPEARKIPSLELLINGMIAYLKRDAIDGWLYKRSKDGVLLPWLVTGMRHMVPIEAKPYVVISLVANTLQSADKEASDDYRQRRSGMQTVIIVDANDIADRSIPQLLAELGYFKECAEFKEEYERQLGYFHAMQPQFGKQFVARRAAYLVKSKQGNDYIPLPEGMIAKVVNDEEILERRFETNADNAFWCEAGVESDFDQIPLHPYLHVFHLELHRNLWVHVDNLHAYEYNPALREKLVLPQDHRDLIDILTADMGVLMEDIVDGKSGGTTILCKGAPGLGKTLTAEVYAEVVKKPLYRVHSGQLGISAESVEANLSTILRRAARWGAILLLDEADVYIRRRDNDLQHNAIVAEFLRTLEYFSGLLFMTTNRTDDIDDAILSRCIAVIKYEMPSREDAMRLWQTLSMQFDVTLDDAIIERLVARFPNTSGRDIKELLKLTAKFCRSKQIPFSEDAFRQCAVFRGIV